MFTGIIEETGSISFLNLNEQSGSLCINAKLVLENTKPGDSIAVNGVCLTVTSLTENSFTADVMAETVRKTSLCSLKKNSIVNLERALSAQGRFGGHIVTGHIDGTGKITEIKKEQNAVWYYISSSKEILSLIVQKGSICIDGISLTVAKVLDSSFAVSIIPHTQKNTNLFTKKVGDSVNLENDILAKYVKKLLSPDSADFHETETYTENKLNEWLREY